MAKQIVFLFCLSLICTFTITFYGYAQGLTLNVSCDSLLAKKLVNQAIGQMQASNYNVAHQKLDSAYTLYSICFGKEYKEIGYICHLRGSIAFFKREFDKSIEYCKLAIDIGQKNGDMDKVVAMAYHAIGACYANKYQLDLAVENCIKSLEIKRKIYGNKHKEVAFSLLNIGIIYKEFGNYHEALKYYNESLAVSTNIAKIDSANLAKNYDAIGIIYEKMGDYQLGLIHKKKAFEIRLSFFGDKHPEVATSYGNLGASYINLGDLDKAKATTEKALKMRLELLGEDHPDLAGSYHNLANIYSSRGDHAKALEYNQKSLQLELKNFGELYSGVADSYRALGINYGEMGLYYKNLEYHKKALEIKLELFGQNHPDIAIQYNNIAAAYGSHGDLENEFLYYEKSLNLWLELLGEEHPNVAKIYHNMGINRLLRKDLEKAEYYFNKALLLHDKLAGMKNSDASTILNSLAELYQSQNNFKESEQIFQKSLGSCNYTGTDSLESTNSVYSTLSTLARIAIFYQDWYTKNLDRNQLEKSFLYFQDVVKTVNFLFKNMNEQSAELFTTEIHKIYARALRTNVLLFSLLDSVQYLQSAFDFAERSKSYLLSHAIHTSNALAFGGIDQNLIQKEHDLRIDLNYLEKQKQGKINEGFKEIDTIVMTISNKLFNLRLRYDSLKTHLEKNYPDYYLLKYDLSTVSVPEVQQKLLAPNQTLLEYFVGDSTIFLMAIRPDLYKVFEIPRNFALDSLVEQMRNGLYSDQKKGLGSFSDASISKYKDAAQVLYKKLLEPAQPWLSERLVIVPDGVLGYIPFESLLTAAPKDEYNFQTYPYLSNKHQISYSYSATLLKEMQEKQRKNPAKKSVLVMAPFYEKGYQHLEDQFRGVLTGSDLTNANDSATVIGKKIAFKPLNATGEEAIKISKLWKGDYYLNKDATENHFNEIASDYNIIHLSTHGVADYRSGDYSYLAFAEVPDTIENELLYVRDLYNLQINAELVILSACETGVGELQRGEGIISLARAFAYAGAKSMVTSLWVSDDNSTKELMIEFHKQLKSGLPKDVALWRAKQEYIKTQKGEKSYPFYWAGFIGIGDMKPINLN